MNLTFTVRVPGRRSVHLKVLVRDPAWVAKRWGSKKPRAADGTPLNVLAWFGPSRSKVCAGTIALSALSLELVAHECCHAAHSLLYPQPEEEALATLTGQLTAAVWNALMKKVMP